MGINSPYRGGKYLLELLTFAERDASAQGDTKTAAGIRDAIDYALGKQLEADIRAKYSLYSGEGQHCRQLLERVTSAAWSIAMEELDQFLATNADASSAQARAYFAQQARLAFRFVRARRAGHYGAFRSPSDAMAWVSDVLVDRVESKPLELADAANEHRVAALVNDPAAEVLLAGAQLARVASCTPSS